MDLDTFRQILACIVSKHVNRNRFFTDSMRHLLVFLERNCILILTGTMNYILYKSGKCKIVIVLLTLIYYFRLLLQSMNK